MGAPCYRLYGAEISYFTAKVRPALRAKAVHFVELLATPAVYREVILPRTGLAFIPIVVTPDGETWQDTSDILDRLEARFPEPALVPPTPILQSASSLLEVYADEFMVLPAMHYRWSFPESEAKARADFAAINGDPAAAGRFADRMKGSLPALGVTPAAGPAIEAHLRDLLSRLEALLEQTPFLLGGRISQADCSLMGPLYAHLYCDAVPGRLLRATAPRVCHWIERCNHPDPEPGGDWLEDSRAAELLRPLLSLVGADAVPVVLDGVRAVECWADGCEEQSAEIPRGVGVHATSLRGTPLSRYTSPYTLWMLQRPLDTLAALPAESIAQVGRALSGTGLENWLGYRPRHRLAKRGFKLAFEIEAPSG
jgi:glutathione S-transferase